MNGVDQMGTYIHHMRRLTKMPSFPVEYSKASFHCPLDFRKRHNLALQQINKRFLQHLELAMPHIVHVGVTTRCNLKCPACPTGANSLGRPSQDLDFDVYTRMVDELRGSLLLMLFWDWGEAFLHPRLIDMIDYAKRSHIKAILSTNGTVGNSKTEIRKLVKSRPDLVIVSVDGATQETYEKFRVGANLASVLSTIERIKEVKDEIGTPYPIVNFRTVVNRYNEMELPRLLRMSEETGADLFSIKSLNPDHREHNSDSEMVPLKKPLARYQYKEESQITGKRIQPRGPLMCGKPMYAPTLNSNGDMVFCSYSSSTEETFGNISKVGFKRVWRSKSARMKRLRFLNNNGTRMCEDCFFKTAHKSSTLYTVPLRPFPSDISLSRPTLKEDLLNEFEQSVLK